MNLFRRKATNLLPNIFLRPTITKKHFANFAVTNDPYKTLSVSINDDIKIIKKKYYKLVNKYHPDKNDGSEVPKQTNITQHPQP
jgi:DnaJ-domain-containing protein 1